MQSDREWQQKMRASTAYRWLSLAVDLQALCPETLKEDMTLKEAIEILRKGPSEKE